MGIDRNAQYSQHSSQRVGEAVYETSLSPAYNQLPSTIHDLSTSNGTDYPLPPGLPPRSRATKASTLPQNPASSFKGKGRIPPPPVRKPDALRHRDAEQSKQIEVSSEEMSFTKDDIIIAIMGVTGAGKSTFISLLSDEEIEIGHGLQSCTTKVGVYYFRYHGVRVFLVDTPGFDDTNRSDSEVLKDVAFWMAAAYSKQTRLAGIIYLHRISDTRMPGSALRNLRMFNKLCGANNLNSVVLATTHWTNLKTGVSIDQETGDARIKELVETEGFWRGMVEQGSEVVKHDGTKKSALDIVLNIVGRKNRIILDIQRQLIDQRLDLNDTDAAQALQAELVAERKIFEKKLADLKQEMEDAIQEGNKKAQREIRAEQAKAEAEIRKTRDETNALRTNLEKIAREKDEQFRKLQEEMAEQREEYQQQLKNTTAALEAERERQRLAAEKHERERKEDAAKSARLAEIHQKSMVDLQNRMREENDQKLIDQMERQRQDQERWYQQQREDAREQAETEEARWQRQLELDRQRQRELVDQREEDARKIRELEREQTKSKGFFIGTMKAVCSVASVGLAWAGLAPWSFAADLLSRTMV